MAYIKTIASYVFLEVSEYSDSIFVSYGGNMGDQLDRVEECFNRLYGDGAFDRVLQLGDAVGSPDYFWSLKISDKTKFFENFKHL